MCIIGVNSTNLYVDATGGWFLIIVMWCLGGIILLGIATMRGYFVWALGGIGAALIIIISGLQSTYSTQSLCTYFVYSVAAKLYLVYSILITNYK